MVGVSSDSRRHCKYQRGLHAGRPFLSLAQLTFRTPENVICRPINVRVQPHHTATTHMVNIDAISMLSPNSTLGLLNRAFAHMT